MEYVVNMLHILDGLRKYLYVYHEISISLRCSSGNGGITL